MTAKNLPAQLERYKQLRLKNALAAQHGITGEEK